MPFTGDSSDSSDGEEYLEGSGSTPRPGAAKRHFVPFVLFFSFFFFFSLFLFLATKLSPGANFYCLRCFSRQSILVAAVFSFLFEAIYYKLGRVHTTPQRLSYRRQFPYMGIFSGKKRFKKKQTLLSTLALHSRKKFWDKLCHQSFLSPRSHTLDLPFQTWNFETQVSWILFASCSLSSHHHHHHHHHSSRFFTTHSPSLLLPHHHRYHHQPLWLNFCV